jgi:hypothetical protein
MCQKKSSCCNSKKNANVLAKTSQGLGVAADTMVGLVCASLSEEKSKSPDPHCSFATSPGFIASLAALEGTRAVVSLAELPLVFRDRSLSKTLKFFKAGAKIGSATVSTTAMVGATKMALELSAKHEGHTPPDFVPALSVSELFTIAFAAATMTVMLFSLFPYACGNYQNKNMLTYGLKLTDYLTLAAIGIFIYGSLNAFGGWGLTDATAATLLVVIAVVCGVRVVKGALEFFREPPSPFAQCCEKPRVEIVTPYGTVNRDKPTDYGSTSSSRPLDPQLHRNLTNVVAVDGGDNNNNSSSSSLGKTS